MSFMNKVSPCRCMPPPACAANRVATVRERRVRESGSDNRIARALAHARGSAGNGAARVSKRWGRRMPRIGSRANRFLTVAARFAEPRALASALRFLLLSAVFLLTPACLTANDLVLSNKFGEVTAEIFIPGDVPVLRGLYVHAANYMLKPDDRWAEAGRAIGFGHIALDIDRKANNRPTKLRKALDAALLEFATKSGHKELPNLPLAGTGHSAGGWVTQIILRTPERAITAAIDCAWVVDSTRLNPTDKSVPMLFTLGTIPDDFKMLPDITNKFLPARAGDWPWALGVQHGCAHDYGNSAAMQIPWMNAVIEARLPRDASALDAPPKLRDLKLEDGWLGDTTKISNQWASIESWSGFKGEKSRAAWFPNRAVAFVWRAWQTKDSPVVLEASAADGSANLPAWSQKSSRDLMLNPGVDVHLGVNIGEGIAVKKVQFLDGDIVLGEMTAPPWQFNWRGPSRGAHAVHAIWEGNDGRRGAVNPALIVVRGKESGR